MNAYHRALAEGILTVEVSSAYLIFNCAIYDHLIK